MHHGIKVPAQSCDSIASIVEALRTGCKVNGVIKFPIVEALELLVAEGFQVLPIDEMGENEGLTYPDSGVVCIREDVYEKAVDGDPRARFTLAHELGHLVLHKNIGLARSNSNLVMKIYENSEWQADEFAGQLLAPDHIIAKMKTAAEIAAKCGISLSSAMIRQKKKNR
ncbi:ImmA/IrrE family metallo-endopeptidase [Chitinibacter sp. GC72]|uniref:ImmA/IrrE family metallo-endopeptidase n=1 Tax=Chitinibacter sp. GC72 TaxID=1526917 RepID=UPI0012FAF50B|nr:ImmA/IrrE family metallo-endopeptidase [Chitinibacter sp. GC72]